MKKLELSLSGKVALITGAAGGIGSSIVEHFAAAGAKIFLTDLNEVGLKKLSEALHKDKVKNMYQAIDITVSGAAAEIVSSVINGMGTIDILVNCAGTNIPKKPEDMTEKDWDDVLDLNLKAMFFLCQAAGKEMIKRGGGKIINISSQAGIVAIPLRAAYGPSKAGVNHLTRQLALEWAQHNIMVNAIAPTFIETPLTKKMFEDKDYRKYVIDNIPLGRMAETKDIAYAAVFLASGLTNMITGHILSVDGGWSIK
ncbi:SDR family NAD(P)-dependent oxidoreductase [Chloroflexota bacterium]